jgi:hypothetical protein
MNLRYLFHMENIYPSLGDSVAKEENYEKRGAFRFPSRGRSENRRSRSDRKLSR